MQHGDRDERDHEGPQNRVEVTETVSAHQLTVSGERSHGSLRVAARVVAGNAGVRRVPGPDTLEPCRCQLGSGHDRGYRISLGCGERDFERCLSRMESGSTPPSVLSETLPGGGEDARFAGRSRRGRDWCAER